jgi:hypothetical protein
LSHRKITQHDFTVGLSIERFQSLGHPTLSIPSINGLGIFQRNRESFRRIGLPCS